MTPCGECVFGAVQTSGELRCSIALPPWAQIALGMSRYVHPNNSCDLGQSRAAPSPAQPEGKK